MLMGILCCLLVFGCQTRRKSEVPQKAVLRFVAFDTESPVHVDCDSLDSFFGKQVTVFTLSDRESLDSLAVILAGLKPSSKGFTPDVRLVMDIYYQDNRMKRLCMSDIALEVEGVEMQFEPRLLSLIQGTLK